MPARYWRPAELPGVELLRADTSTHRYARHAHEGYAIGVVEAGAHAFAARGTVWTAVPGRIVVVNPDQAHDGGPASPDGVYSYRMFYVDAAAFGDVAAPPFFAQAVVSDPVLARRLARLHRALEGAGSRLEREERLLAALAALAARHGGASPAAAPRAAPPPVAIALDYLSANFAADVSLTELAAVAGVARFALVRAFRRHLGLPPHLYLTQLRLRHARRLLRLGEPSALVAAAAGFADQSHLIRKFKAAYGVTPGQFVAGRKNVQYAAAGSGS